MLQHFFHTPLSLRLAQAAAVSILAIAVALFARARHIPLLGQTVVALARGIVQIVAVGLVLVLIIRSNQRWWSVPVLAVMIAVASLIAARRARYIPGAFWSASIGVALGSGAVIAIMAALGAIEFSVYELVPVGSMLIANCMNTCAQALERFGSDVAGQVGEIEAALALGADPRAAVARQVNAAVQASMIPRIDNLASLGIVWIPGLMAGMLIKKEDPVAAAIYNFAVIAMIYAAGGVTALTSVLLARDSAFSPAGQLLLRTKPPQRKKSKG